LLDRERDQVDGRAARRKARELERAAALDQQRKAREAERAELLDQVEGDQLRNGRERRRYLQLQQREPQTPQEALTRKQRAHTDKVRRRLRDLGIKNAEPKEIPTWLFERVQSCIADGRCARIWLDQHPNKVATGLLKPALVGGLAGGGSRARRNRMLVAELLLLLGLSVPTKRRGDCFKFLVKGVPEAAILAALRDPETGKRPGRSTLAGTHRGKLERNEYGKVTDTRTDGTVGYTRALKNLRIIYTRQARWRGDSKRPPTRGWENATANELPPVVTKSGWRVSLNRFWIVTPQYSDPYNDAEKARLYAAFLDGIEPYNPELYVSPFSEPASPSPSEVATGPPAPA
ncbi:MAG: hypothetical protein JSV86_07390, partial [Gemmatimonadota bacterium]